jgi:hypothetical protein
MHANGHLRHSRYLDIVISAGSNSDSEANVKAIRAVRVLRSLRVIHGLPSLARVINSIGAALPRLLYVSHATATADPRTLDLLPLFSLVCSGMHVCVPCSFVE